jgi:hypothetical protein
VEGTVGQTACGRIRCCRRKGRSKSKLYHIGMGESAKDTRVTLLVAGLDIRVLSEEGQMLGHLSLDPSRDYQPQEA